MGKHHLIQKFMLEWAMKRRPDANIVSKVRTRTLQKGTIRREVRHDSFAQVYFAPVFLQRNSERGVPSPLTEPRGVCRWTACLGIASAPSHGGTCSSLSRVRPSHSSELNECRFGSVTITNECGKCKGRVRYTHSRRSPTAYPR